MSKKYHNHAANATAVRHLLNEVTKLSKEELESLYGIELRADKSVFDSTYQMSFGSIGEWAQFSVEQDSAVGDDDSNSHYNKYDQEDDY